ncbi:uncharacterized protein [Amphiura filiformis]|uniref:uncharacterized protein n=1 Tax=Amphiura filiformis TaxID=82378 RepID=UPI003B20DEF3
MEDDRQQAMAFIENKQPMQECFNFTSPLYDESLVLVYTIVNDTSGGQIDLRCHIEPILCNHHILDREEGDKYVMVIEANTCDPKVFDCGSCETGQAGPGRVSRNVDQTANEICLQPIEVGPCEALIPRWAHDNDLGQCVQFNYGGCDGNENNFLTKEECQTKCNVQPSPVAVASNQMVMDIAVRDINDERPQTTGFIPGLPKKFWIGIADNVAYNSTVFKIDATDRDVNHSLVYNLEVYQSPSLQNIKCVDLPLLKLSDQGNLLSRDAVYSYLLVNQTDIWVEQLFCEYVVTVTDVNTDPDYPEMRSVSIPTKIKALYSFEHAIILIDSPPEDVVGKAEDLASCFSQGMTHYVLRVEFVRAEYKGERNGLTEVNPSRTDLWVYAVHDKTGEFAKYWDIKSAWDANTVKDQCLPIISPLADGESPGTRVESPGIRPAHIRKDYLYPYASYVGWAVLAMACLVFLAALICLFILYESWDRYLIERTRFMQAIMMGRSKYVDAAVLTDHWDYDAPISLDYMTEKRQLFESQEVIMDFFSEHPWPLVAEQKQRQFETQEMTMDLFAEYSDGYIPSDEAILSIIRSKTSGTEVQTIVDRGEFEEDDNEMVSTTRDFNAVFGATEDRNVVFGATGDRNGVYSITKEVTTSYDVVDVPADRDDKLLLAKGKGKGSLKTTDKDRHVVIKSGSLKTADKDKHVVIKTKTPGSLETADKDRHVVIKTGSLKTADKDKHVVIKTKTPGSLETADKDRHVVIKTGSLKTTDKDKHVVIKAKTPGSLETTDKARHVVIETKTPGGKIQTVEKVSVSKEKGGDITRVVKTEVAGSKIKTVEKASVKKAKGEAITHVVRTEAPASNIKTVEVSVTKEKGGDITGIVKSDARGSKIKTVEKTSVKKGKGEAVTHVVRTEAPVSNIKTVEVSVTKEKGGDITGIVKSDARGSKIKTVEKTSVKKGKGESITHVVRTEAPASNIKTVEVSVTKEKGGDITGIVKADARGSKIKTVEKTSVKKGKGEAITHVVKTEAPVSNIKTVEVSVTKEKGGDITGIVKSDARGSKIKTVEKTSVKKGKGEAITHVVKTEAPVTGGNIRREISTEAAGSQLVTGGQIRRVVSTESAGSQVTGGQIRREVSIEATGNQVVTGGQIRREVSIEATGSQLVTGGQIRGVVSTESAGSQLVTGGQIRRVVSTQAAGSQVTGGQIRREVSIEAAGSRVTGGQIRREVSTQAAGSQVTGGQIRREVSIEATGSRVTGGQIRREVSIEATGSQLVTGDRLDAWSVHRQQEAR